MAETVIEATVQVMVEKLVAVAAQEIGILFGLKTELANLKKSFERITAFLQDAARRQVEDEAVKLWIKDLENVAYEADNLFDEYQYEALRRKVEIRNQIKRKVCFFFSFANPLVFRSNMGHKIRNLTVKLKTLDEEANRHHLEKRITESALALPFVSETNSFTVDPVVVGRETDASKIVDMLVNPSKEEVVLVIPIVGMGGLGKTTLARLVIKDPRIIKHFDKTIWVCVSESFDGTKILKRILEILTTTVVRDESIEVVLKKIYESLKGKRYLLILDDLWNDRREVWESFKNSLVGISSNKGNFIIVTTRLKSVATVVGSLPPYPLDKLSDEDCWSLIKRKTFSSNEVPIEFEAIGKQIACKCQGLPLAANMVGGTLQGKGRDDWISLLERGFSDPNIEESGVLPILKVSYDRLPSSLFKKCFAYCSIFPKDADIEKERLVQLWMAEGFLQENNVDDMESSGSKIYDLLLQNSFLQEAETDEYTRIKYSKMHDLVHDLAISVSKSECFNDENLTTACIPRKVRYLAVESLGEVAHNIAKDEAIYLRTLILGSDVPEGAFKKFKQLRVLDLQGTHIEELTGSISKLIHLRFLDVSSTRVQAFPESICKLFNLQTLRAHRPFGRIRLPDHLHLLVNLRHIMMNPVISNIYEMPLGIGKLTCLRTLSFFKVGLEKGRLIEELGYLKNLKGSLKIDNLEQVNGKEEAVKADLIGKPNIQKLELNWIKLREVENNDQEVLEGLQPHPNIKSLIIRRFSGDNFPSWIMKMTVGKVTKLDNLTEIRLINCQRCLQLPTLGHLPELKILELYSLINVKSIGPSFHHPHDSSESSRTALTPFRSLQRFTLSDMPSLVEWVASSSAETSRTNGFPMLEYLIIDNCKLKSVPIHGFACLKELEIKKVDVNLVLDMIQGNDLSSLTRLKFTRIYNLTHLSSSLLSNSRHLRHLELYYCHELTHLDFHEEDGHNLPSLEVLDIESCSSLVSIGRSQGLASLVKLYIYKCSNLASCALDWQRMSCLSEVSLTDCRSWRSLPQDISGLCNLSWLSLRFSETEFDLLSETLQRVQGIHVLSLSGSVNWDALPHQLQHLTSLTDLSLEGFGVEALPEWFGNFSSLVRLKIENFPRLKHLTSKEAMQRLSKLERTEIVECPLLKEKFPNQTYADSPWIELLKEFR